MAITFSHTLVPNPQKEDYQSHLHNDYEILFFYEGDADYIIEGTTYNLEKNTLLLIKPAVYHYLSLRSSSPYRRVVFNFSQNDVESSNQQFLASAGSVFHIPSDSVIEKLFEIVYKTKCDEKDNEYLLSSTLNLILINLKNLDAIELAPQITNPTIHNISAWFPSRR